MIGTTLLPLALYSRQDVVAVVICAATAVGILFAFAWPGAPKPVSVAVFFAVGLSGAAAMPGVAAVLGVGSVLLVLATALLYATGAVIYALERPNPVPEVFGFHDVFHLFVVVAAAVAYVNILLFVVPVAQAG